MVSLRFVLLVPLCGFQTTTPTVINCCTQAPSFSRMALAAAPQLPLGWPNLKLLV